MTQETWTSVDNYINDLFVPSDGALEAALAASNDAGLPNIQVAPNQGKMISILAQSIGAKTILEIGTLGGYSTIWLARALPADGKLISLEIDPKHAEVARANVARAGLADKVDIRLGKAIESLPKVAAEGHVFDFVFIDADKPSNTEYFEWALKLTHKGSLIITDNVIRNGGVADPNSSDPSVTGVQRFNQRIAPEKRVTTTQIQTVGSKGYDGVSISLVLSD
ncbi:MAG: methyltransferase [Chloroflexi bacterium]|nr:methyltransferase [Chloroflexota bacterium]